MNQRNLVTAYDGDIRPKIYPKKDLNPAMSFENCGDLKCIDIAGSCKPCRENIDLPPSLKRIYTSSEPHYVDMGTVESAIMYPCPNIFTVSLRHPYSKFLNLVSFQKINSKQYRIVEWNMPNYECTPNPQSCMYSRTLMNREVIELIDDILRDDSVRLPRASIPIDFRSNLRGNITVFVK